ncbi:restriction endonuclease subunit S [Aeromonas caviae]|uniref:restriction endonuclease subunit S n=1 Tax=Aeromonas caviae TaxID=648 RepID=UPI0030046FF6
MSEAVATSQQGLVGKYKPYPEYKDSGVEWLGDMPSHWLTSKLRYMFTFGKGLTITKENLRDEGIPCVNYGEVHSKYGFEVDPTKHPLRCVEEDYLKTSSSSVLNIGDFVFADTSEDIDGSGNFTQLTSDVVTFAGYHTIIVRPIDKSSHRFFAYLFDSKEFRTAIRHAVKGVKVFSITQAILRGADIWLPSQDERQRIAAFLDYETARIDRLIAQQQRLIELLKEKRQAVISHAVTKGLNPDASMKDSGVEWLGQVPEHWVVKQYRYATQLFRGKFGHRPRNDPALYDGPYPFIQTGDIARTGKFITEYSQTLNELGRQVSQRFPAGTLVMAIAANIGDTAILEFDAYCPDSVVGFKPREDLDIEFLRLTFAAALQALEQTSTQSTQANLNLDRVGSLYAAFPPYEEQLDLIDAVARIESTYNQLELVALQGIHLLQERRTVLISAAVTGKIDLRGWTPPADEVAA